jgi:hypothetical protein
MTTGNWSVVTDNSILEVAQFDIVLSIIQLVCQVNRAVKN